MGVGSTARTILLRSRPWTWQVHVYGSASAELAAWCGDHDVPLHVFGWRSDMRRRDLPAMRSICSGPTPMWRLPTPLETPGVIDRYCAEHGIRLGVRRRTEPIPPRASGLQTAALIAALTSRLQQLSILFWYSQCYGTGN